MKLGPFCFHIAISTRFVSPSPPIVPSACCLISLELRFTVKSRVSLMIKVYLPNDKSELRFSSNWMSKDNSSMTIIHLIIDEKFLYYFLGYYSSTKFILSLKIQDIKYLLKLGLVNMACKRIIFWLIWGDAQLSRSLVMYSFRIAAFICCLLDKHRSKTNPGRELS